LITGKLSAQAQDAASQNEAENNSKIRTRYCTVVFLVIVTKRSWNKSDDSNYTVIKLANLVR
jgi:hypothetical protein